MTTGHGLVIGTVRHVQAFLDDNAALIGPSIASPRRNLDDVVAQLTTLGVTQTTSKMASAGATARQESLRATIRTNQHEAHRRRGKQRLRDVPEFASLTISVNELGTTQLVAAAAAMPGPMLVATLKPPKFASYARPIDVRDSRRTQLASYNDDSPVTSQDE